MIISHIDAEFEGDTYFPEVDWNQWNAIDTVHHPVNEDNPTTLLKW
jgi:hypothetical protein